MRTSKQIVAEIEERLGFLPPFFGPAQQNPQVLENLWQQTLLAYIDNPLPALFKEKLSAYLSRYSAIPYYTSYHSSNLCLLEMNSSEVLKLVESPPPTKTDIDKHLKILVEQSFLKWQETSVLEESLLFCAIFIAIEQRASAYYRQQLRQIIGAIDYQHLVTLIAYIKMRHEWTEAYPEVAFAADHLDKPDLVNFNYQEQEKRELQSSETALRESEARYRSLVHATAQAVWTANPQGHVVDDIPSWQLLTGQSQEAIQGWGWLDAIHPDDRAETAQQWSQAVATQGIYKIEHRVRVIDGSYRFFLAQGVPVLDLEGKVLEWVGTHTDIDALHQSQTRFQNLVANMPAMVYRFLPCADDSDKFIFVNSASCELLELEPKMVLQDASSFVKLIHPDDLPSFQESVATSAQNFLPWRWVGRIITPSGQLKWIQGSSRPEQTTEGNIWDGLLIDITERKQAEERLHQLTINLESLVAERTNQLQQVLEFEAMLKRITDKVRDSLDESQILQTVVKEMVLVLGVSCCNTALYDQEQGTSNIYYEYATAHPEAQARKIQMTNLPEVYHLLLQGQYCQFCSIVPNPVRGRVAMLACPIVDGKRVLGDLWLINQQDHAFSELEIRLVQQVANQCAIAIRQARLHQAAHKQVAELEKLSCLKDDFLSTVSHELRTPLTNMKMALYMLSVSPTAERRERYLEILEAECIRESQLIDDLLDLQRLETASYAIPLNEAVSLQDWLPTLIEPFRIRTEQRQQTLQINFPPNLPVLFSNRASLERTVAELLNNACKYTPAGGEIVLNCDYKSAEAVTVLTVSNSVEIPAAELAQIFEKFYRILDADPWKQGGTGLGLALVQKLVEQLRGTLFVESCGGWTAFTVQLPNQPT